MTKIVFFGTSEFSASILETLRKSFEVVLVVTAPDKPVGRKQQIQQSPVSEYASKQGMKVIKPESLKNGEIAQQIEQVSADLFLVVAYGKIIPQQLLDLPAKGAINIHGSLLPELRGASPIQGALLAGKSQSGITIMLMDDKMDHGPILKQAPVIIEADDRFPELEKKLLDAANNILNQTIQDFLAGVLIPQAQVESDATFTKIISKNDGQIDWASDAENIYNQFRAYYVWPNIWTKWDNQLLKITDCAPAKTFDKNPGTVLESEGKIFIQAKDSSLELRAVQIEGKSAMPINDFVRGHISFIGAVLPS